MKAGYALQTGAPVALSAATAKTILCVLSPSSFGIDVVSLEIGFDGVTATNAPVLVELCTSTAATNSTPGTNNTTGTVNQVYGRSITAGFTGFYNSTSEPTVLTPVYSWSLTPNGGTVLYEFPRDRTPDVAVSAGFAIRCTAPNAVNARATLVFERC